MKNTKQDKNTANGKNAGRRWLRCWQTATAALALGCGLATADDAVAPAPATPAPPPPPPKKNPWSTTAAVGLTLTSGNTRTTLATATLDSSRKWDGNEALFGAGVGHGTDRDVRNSDFANGYGQYNRTITDGFYGGLRLDANYDGLARLSYRVRVSPLVGYYFIKTTNTTLSAEVGPSAVFEKYMDKNPDTYLGVRFGERFEHKLSATTKIWESVDYVPEVDKWVEKYVITGEAGIDSAINKHWSLRIVFQDVYDSQPSSTAANYKQHYDTRLIAGAAYKF